MKRSYKASKITNKQVIIMMPPEMAKRLDEAADKMKVSRGEFVRKLFESYEYENSLMQETTVTEVH